ncbi:hypothetical protein CO670_14480 [Rhizobium sp. J15]|uniref:DUF2934 domain-containing protein n=1 Tax=Rhizobium sp. J15 TaxID=2035450 RepID=UPI000BE8EB3E|nr:DUF2934 domain-containing protein [Rhizobium sp. J15]PDT16098.1 hypothetical protein CO670_14480 [Rhizobium sp. J15]
MKTPARRKTNGNATNGAEAQTSAATEARRPKTARRTASVADDRSRPQTTSREDEIRKRAYSLWEKEGRPEGRQAHHWSVAEHELDAQWSEADNPPKLEALREASRQHADTFLVKTDLEDADQREASPGTREQD